jgi:4-hydroxy-tetrahydrodipicolinate reductase
MGTRAKVASVRLGVVGASGRMGRAVVRLAREAGMEIACAVATTDVGRDVGELAGVGALGVPIADAIDALAAAKCEVCIEFSTPAGARATADVAATSGCALVSGTTGLDEAARRALDEASKKTAVMWEPNMSLGVHVLGVLLRRAVEMLGPDFDVEIVEAHHRMKADAPSGTAARLAEIAREARGDGAKIVHGREGRPGARPRAEIGVHAVRGGDVVGDHTVSVLGVGERLELVHRASSRELFAHGAVRAAAWICGKAPGRYGLADVLRTKT